MNDESNCPIPAAHRGLRDAHMLWHQALDDYHNPEKFRANLNATIQSLRNITFALQNEKSAFPDFEKWYGPWQQKLKDDQNAKWMNSARVAIVHQGDLEKYSVAHIKLITWQAKVISSLQVPIETPAHLILDNPTLLSAIAAAEASDPGVKDASIAIERCWSAEGLNDREILSVVSGVYGLLADLVLDAHSHLQQMDCIPEHISHGDFPNVQARTGVLECMTPSIDKRTEIFSLATKERAVPVASQAPWISRAEVIERYGEDPQNVIGNMDQQDPLTLAEKLLFTAKRILRRDKRHCWMMFVRDGAGHWHQMSFLASGRAERQILMQVVSEVVSSRGCDALIEIGEQWMAKLTDGIPPDTKDVESIPGREESLAVTVATRDGLLRMYVTPIKRGTFGGIKLGDTEKCESLCANHLRPVIEVWEKQSTFRRQDGSQSRVWEPDVLDGCPCGGPQRYGECCRTRLIQGFDRSEAQKQFASSIAARNFRHAEELARAGLAKYVTWIRQHTLPALQSNNAGRKFYEKIVDIDALAMEALTDDMFIALTLAEKADLVLPQLRRLKELVGVPRIATRLTAIASRWLFLQGNAEEAVLELDSLGRLADINDALALSLMAQYGDLTEAGKKVALERAVEVATEDERNYAQLHLATFLQEIEPKAALALINSVIADTDHSSRSRQERSRALILRWVIGKNPLDFEAALHEMKNDDDHRHQNSIYLIDAGKYEEAEGFLQKLIENGDVKAKLLTVDIKLRTSSVQQALELFTTIQEDTIPPPLRYPYAHTMSLLALATGLVDLRDKGLSLLEGLPPDGSERDKEIGKMIQLLKNKW